MNVLRPPQDVTNPVELKNWFDVVTDILNKLNAQELADASGSVTVDNYNDLLEKHQDWRT